MSGPIKSGSLLAGSVSRSRAAYEEACRLQLLAADPAASVWVNANAGTGKTHVLVQRILRLLLDGAKPQSLLCLTFTKNAAAEMEARVLQSLGRWATLTAPALDGELAVLLGREAQAAERKRARCLFGEIADAALGLPILTLHGFCEQILRRFPLEAGMPANFTVLSEEDAQTVLDAAVNATLDAAAKDDGGPLGEALATIVRNTDEGQFTKLLAGMLNNRANLLALLSGPEEGDPFDILAARLHDRFGLASGESAASIGAEQNRVAKEAAALGGGLLALLLNGSATDKKRGEELAALIGAGSDEIRCQAAKSLFLTKEGKPRASMMTGATAQKAGSRADALCNLRDIFATLQQKLCSAKIVEASLALVRLAAFVLGHYQAEKRARCAADFEDLIERTLSLLGDAPSAEWVLFQLDSRIDHVLVDEAQDTSPAQWTIIERLTGDFFAGEGVREKPATIFAVGDVKQSIYGFQGAEPRLMADREAFYTAQAAEARRPWRSIPLGLSFRSTSAVLDAVDAAWRGVTARGLGAGAASIAHEAHRSQAAGLIEIHEPELPAKRENGEVWEPELDEDRGERNAAERLASRIAANVAGWLRSGEILHSRGRPIRPGDILILLRKRAPLLDLLLRALKAEHIPVAGADRLSLLDSIAVMDLIALGKALVMPGDDLALAAALKSPLFGLDDDDLFALCHGREGSVWDSLFVKAPLNARFAGVCERLSRWQDLALRLPPFDFYHRLLEAEDMRHAFLARLGRSCEEALDEFLRLAESAPPEASATLSNFLIWIETSAAEVKREPKSREDSVRVMTVHGAKGLEADIVILADSCTESKGKASSIIQVADGRNLPPLPVWVVKGAKDHPTIGQAKDEARQAEREESMRLLYVAMTRARDRLYVMGYQHHDKRPDGCWYDLILEALRGEAEETRDDDGRMMWRLARRGSESNAAIVHLVEVGEPVPLPGLALADATAEPFFPILSPSGLAEAHGRAAGISAPLLAAGGEQSGGEERRFYGQLVHALLHYLPRAASADHLRIARNIAGFYKAHLPEDAREAAIGEALAALGHPSLAPLFALPCLCEAELAGHIGLEGEAGGALFGRIDRLVFDGDELLLLDYKTAAAIPSGANSVPQAHLLQMAVYRHLLERMMPGAKIRAALLYSAGPVLMLLPDHNLDIVMADLRQRTTCLT